MIATPLITRVLGLLFLRTRRGHLQPAGLQREAGYGEDDSFRVAGSMGAIAILSFRIGDRISRHIWSGGEARGDALFTTVRGPLRSIRTTRRARGQTNWHYEVAPTGVTFSVRSIRARRLGPKCARSTSKA